jgi:HlyD family secretion protein
MKIPIKKILLILVVLLGLAGLVYAFLPKPVPVDFGTVERGLLRVTVDEDGKTRIKERFVISAPLAGQLLRVELKPGATVKAGDTLLAVIEPSDPALLDVRAKAEAEARVKSAEAHKQAASAKAEATRQAHSLTKVSFERAKRLKGTPSISVEEYDQLEHKERMAQEESKAADFGLQVAAFDLEQAKAAFQRTKPTSPGDVPLGRFEIRAPVDGKVLRVLQESATIVVPGTKLLEIGDPGDLEMEIDVLSTDAVKMRPGAKVIIEHWGGDAPLIGRIRLIEPAAFLKISALGVEEQRVYVIVDFDDPPSKRPTLGDAYRVEARIVIFENEQALKVPAGALFRQGDGWAVFTVQEGNAKATPVKIGRTNGLETEVLEGLKEKEQIILHPSDRVKEGVAVVSR